MKKNNISKSIFVIIISILLIFVYNYFFKSNTIYLNTYYFTTRDEVTRGLMFVKKPLGEKGALFIYKSPQQLCITMKNTFIPLEAIILDKNFKVLEIIKDLIPHEEKVKCSSNKNAMYFIEVDKGFSEKKNIKVNDKVICNKID